MKVFFILSGEHATLPKAETLAVLESMDVKHEIIDSLDNVLIIKADKIKGIEKRLSLTHKVCEFLGSCNPDFTDIAALIKNTEIILGNTFAARIKRVKKHSRGVKTGDLEREIGSLIEKKTQSKVNLSNPEDVVLGVLTDRFVLGREMFRVDRYQYELRKPHLRPYFYPGSLSPRIARAVVNLTRVRKGEKLIDPFCGTGGLLIEAGLVGARVHGCDINPEILKGCKKNLKNYGISNFNLEERDSKTLGDLYKNHFDAIASDLPYGISTSTKGLRLTELYRDALKSCYTILKPTRFACILSPEKLDLEEPAKNMGFEVVDRHLERIHRSLTRRIIVVRKPC